MSRLLAATLIGLSTIALARAQEYPNRPINFVIPYPAGGVTDGMARLLAEKLQASLGQPVVIDNAGGGNGVIGTAKVARAAPDGYAFLLGNVETNLTNQISQPVTFDVFRDFDPVVMAPSYPFLIVSKNDLPTRTLPELVAWLGKNQDKALQGTVGAGSAQHLCGLRMQKQLNMKWSFVPYRGGAQALQDMLAGSFDIMCTATGSFLPQVRAGAIRAYAVTAAQRMEGAPEIPTVDEAGGLPGFHVGVWNAVYAPKGTPPAAIAKFHDAMVAAMNDPPLRKRIIDMGLDMPAKDLLPTDALAKFHRAEADIWWPIMREMDLTAK